MFPTTVILILGSSLAVVLSANAPTAAKPDAAKPPSAAADGPHMSVLDRLPILDLLKNPKVVEGYTGCLLEKGPCTPDAAEVRGE